ncbi:predicted protein [Chaetomium globosum CBS 148.51]|uniref:Uncharacterized protein n=1 Tax=Chaetomium globosum (strain ATCC 6205 / CBS 148.51 / DSM 1962 / NBRC 6347 / NRRL 1970) TaxID=306901 RepID=Q2GWD8_CHAGB|nr:uncharacterized protein CHGG_07716 [Chaetomium globosum CBS 148.51]EAQ86463.1 predicted protein [Chaetomium globosum CBS 148.51]
MSSCGKEVSACGGWNWPLCWCSLCTSASRCSSSDAGEAAGARRVSWLWKRLRRTLAADGTPLRTLDTPDARVREEGACLSAI